jgi:hypothetical protein
MPAASRARALEIARDAIRDVYRNRWNLPFCSVVLSHTSNLMLWGSADTSDEEFDQVPGSPPYVGGCIAIPGDTAGQQLDPFTARLLRGLAKQVFREYQRALWDPAAGMRACVRVCARMPLLRFSVFLLAWCVSVLVYVCAR